MLHRSQWTFSALQSLKFHVLYLVSDPCVTLEPALFCFEVLPISKEESLELIASPQCSSKYGLLGYPTDLIILL